MQLYSGAGPILLLDDHFPAEFSFDTLRFFGGSDVFN